MKVSYGLNEDEMLKLKMRKPITKMKTGWLCRDGNGSFSLWCGKRDDIFWWPDSKCWENQAGARGEWSDYPLMFDIEISIWDIELTELPEPGTCIRAAIEIFVHTPK